MENKSYVIDCNFVLKWFFSSEKDSDICTDFLLEAKNKKIRLYSPDLIFAEFSNVLTKYYRKGDLSFSECLIYNKDFLGLCNENTPRVIGLSNFRNEILDLALSKKTSYYDGEYLYLSKMLNTELLTFDKELKKKVK